MFKKIIMGTLALVALNKVHAENNASGFTGFHAGVQAGLNAAKTNYKDLTSSSGKTLASTSGSKTKGSFLAGVFAGYGMGLASCWYVGGELYANFSNKATSSKAASNYQVKEKGTYDIGVKGRFGYIINQQVMAFLGLGVEYEKFRNKQYYSGSQVARANKNITSFAPSLGADYLLSTHTFLRGEYAYLIGSSKTVSFNTSSRSASNGSTVKVNNNQQRFAVAVGYKF